MQYLCKTDVQYFILDMLALFYISLRRSCQYFVENVKVR